MGTKVAVATTSSGAADVAAEVAELGGNAVDCAIAAAIYSTNTEPGVCALAGSAYVTVWPAAADPVTIDGNVAVPGIGRQEGPAPPADQVHMEYGGSVNTVVGPASVAVPGTPAALDLAATRYAALDWRQLVAPTIRAARDGFPLSSACHYYLQYSGDAIFGRSDDGHGALHHADGSLREAGSTIRVPHLAESLEVIADDGCRAFYEGAIAEKITAHVEGRGGLLTARDLQSYEPIVRDSLTVDVDDWRVATNPPPAVGGAVLSAMLLAFAQNPVREWDAEAVRQLVRVQEAALSYRMEKLDLAEDPAAAIAELLGLARSGELLSRRRSGATVHTSAVDDTGLACAITASSGYGSGEMPAGTGLWLNNCLGELELNRHGLEASPPGRRLPSNMAPTTARCDGRVLAMGSPGADRITTALHQFIINYTQLRLGLFDAVAHPRVHLDIGAEEPNLAVEPGLDVPDTGYPLVRHDAINMYFGGVGAALFDAQHGFEVAADPRREGGTFISDGP